jgi:hypothetical protein
MFRNQLRLLSLVGALTCAAAPAGMGSDCDGTGWVLQCPSEIAVGQNGALHLQGPTGGDIAFLMVSIGEGPVDSAYGTICLDFPLATTFLIPLGTDGTATLPFTLTDTGGLSCNQIFLQFLTCLEQRGLSNQCAMTLLDETCGDCVVIIDEETIDNDIKTIEACAEDVGEEPDVLVNDDRPTEVGNPPLVWNELYPGEIVVIPGGQVDDEGLFALPEDVPFELQDFVNGTVAQEDLDPVFDVMPLRNHELFSLIGRTCVAVVYDSDISMNFLPIQGNLQGARYGLFRFTVLNVVVPGSLDESKSSSSLYDLLVRVEPPSGALVGYQVQVRDHEPDSIQTNKAEYDASTGLLEVTAVSNFAPSAIMTLSIDGFVLEAPMVYNSSTGEYEYSTTTATNLDGRRLLVSTDAGGSYNVFID